MEDRGFATTYLLHTTSLKLIDTYTHTVTGHTNKNTTIKNINANVWLIIQILQKLTKYPQDCAFTANGQGLTPNNILLKI